MKKGEEMKKVGGGEGGESVRAGFGGGGEGERNYTCIVFDHKSTIIRLVHFRHMLPKLLHGYGGMVCIICNFTWSSKQFLFSTWNATKKNHVNAHYGLFKREWLLLYASNLLERRSSNSRRFLFWFSTSRFAFGGLLDLIWKQVRKGVIFVTHWY